MTSQDNPNEFDNTGFVDCCYWVRCCVSHSQFQWFNFLYCRQRCCPIFSPMTTWHSIQCAISWSIGGIWHATTRYSLAILIGHKLIMFSAPFVFTVQSISVFVLQSIWIHQEWSTIVRNVIDGVREQRFAVCWWNECRCRQRSLALAFEPIFILSAQMSVSRSLHDALQTVQIFMKSNFSEFGVEIIDFFEFERIFFVVSETKHSIHFFTCVRWR